MVGVAVKVTDVPEQIVVAVAVAVTLGVTDGLTVIVTAVEVAEVGLGQVAFDVITTRIKSPFASVVVV